MEMKGEQCHLFLPLSLGGFPNVDVFFHSMPAQSAMACRPRKMSDPLLLSGRQ